MVKENADLNKLSSKMHDVMSVHIRKGEALSPNTLCRDPASPVDAKISKMNADTVNPALTPTMYRVALIRVGNLY